MERLLQRFETSDKALKTLEEIYAFDHPTPLERDAFIQRFEYTYESIWKLGKQYLRDIEGVDLGSPKRVIRSSREVGLLDEEETILALHMVNDRNLTTHTYNEQLADEIFQKIPGYTRLMRLWWENMKKSIPQ